MDLKKMVVCVMGGKYYGMTIFRQVQPQKRATIKHGMSATYSRLLSIIRSFLHILACRFPSMPNPEFVARSGTCLAMLKSVTHHIDTCVWSIDQIDILEQLEMVCV